MMSFIDFIGILALLVFVSCVAASDAQDPYAPAANTKGRFDYGIVIDAGSTGSRLHIFRWHKRVYKFRKFGEIVGSHLSLPEEIDSHVIVPGLSSFAGQESGSIARYLAPLLEKAKASLRHIDDDVDFHRTPIYLGATAGLRVLSEDVLHPLLEDVREAFHQSPFKSDYHGTVRVLAGEEEGAFGWLCVNAGRKEGISSFPRETLGVVDLGGASAQISFIPEGPSLKAGLFPMHFGNFLRNGPIHLYTHSFLNFGYVSAWNQVGGYLARRSQQAQPNQLVSIQHPCMPPGMRWNVTAADFGLSVTSDDVERSNGPIRFVGTGDLEACADLARRIIPTDVPCFFEGECSFLGEYQPLKDDTRFAVIGEYAHAYKGLAVDPRATLRERLHHLRETCGLPEEAQRVYGMAGGYKGGAASLICWIAVWSVVLLSDGLKFGLDGHELVWNAAEWGGDDSWAKGKMIYETNFYPWYIGNASYRRAALGLAQESEDADALVGRSHAEACSFFILGMMFAWVLSLLRPCVCRSFARGPSHVPLLE